MKRVFDSPFLNKAALVLIWLLLMGGTFFYANKNYFLYHENPNLIKADGYYLYNFGSPRHYYWALPVKFTHEGKVYHSQLPLDIRDESSSCTVDLAFTYRQILLAVHLHSETISPFLHYGGSLFLFHCYFFLHPKEKPRKVSHLIKNILFSSSSF